MGGFKVSAIEVESAINQIKEVADSRGYAIPNSVCGAIVGVDVTLQSTSTITSAEIIKSVSELLPKYAVPRIIRFTNGIQTTDTFKKVRQ